MSSYQVKHLATGEIFSRPYIHINTKLQPPSYDIKKHDQSADQQQQYPVETFHKTLPDYNETTLHALPSLASELGFKHIFVKDESTRFGLPSFKILGASWAIHRAICQRLGLPYSSTSLQDVAAAIKSSDESIRLVTCTEGNWGRATARTGRYLGVPVRIYVPYFMNKHTQDLLRGEGADVVVLDNGSYDDAIAAVRKEAASLGSLMVMDTSWEGYEEVPGWVTEGYSTMLRETDRQVAAQTNGASPDLAVVSVGVGSWAHAAVSHYRSQQDGDKQVFTVEPIAAPSFKESLHCGGITPIATGETIMNGMNCGTTSKIAWPVLQGGVSAAVVVTETASDRAVKYLHANGVMCGPCGAATVEALRRICDDVPGLVEDRESKVVVLFSTEGMREYHLADE